MLAQGELIGALNIGFDAPDAFTSEHIEIAQEVSSTLAVAIQQAELYEQILTTQDRCCIAGSSR